MKNLKISITIITILIINYISCGDNTFIDKTAELGLQLSNNAVACIDYDKDGWVDIYCSGTLWKNNEGTKFTKASTIQGSAIWADINNDGFPDPFSYSHQKIFLSDKAQNFTAQPFPDLAIICSRGASFADYNSDGFIDLYIGGYENWEKQITYPDAIVLNLQGKSWQTSWTETRYRARGITSCDFDQDGDMDIYVSNYRLQPNLLWINDGNAKFKESAPEYNATATWGGFNGGHSIGAAWGDFDNDGLIDIFAGNFAHDDNRGHQPHPCFLKNTGPGTDYKFKDMGQCGIFYQESYASPAVADFDNDGDLDLFFTTVYGTASFGKKNFPVLYQNEGNWKFTDVTKQNNLDQLPPTYQAAWADFNNDGSIDLVTSGRVYINQNPKNNWLKIKLTGDGQIINSDAIGTQIKIKMDNKTVTRQVEAGTGEGNQNEFTLHFGLGQHAAPINIEILWNNQFHQKIDNVNPNQLLNIKFDKQNCSAK